MILEDNTAAIALANDGDKYRPRTKHLSLKWHHFRDQIKQGWLKVRKIDTKVNWADIFTKPLPKPHFEFLRDAMMGWRTPDELKKFLEKQHLNSDLPLFPKQAIAFPAIYHLKSCLKQKNTNNHYKKVHWNLLLQI